MMMKCRVTTVIITLNLPYKGYVSILTKVSIPMVFRRRHINHTISMNYVELIHGLPYVAHAHTAAQQHTCNGVTQFSNMAPSELTVRASCLYLRLICDILIGMCSIQSTVQ